MRQYAWYSPELDVIILQCIISDDFAICFGWDDVDMHEATWRFPFDGETDLSQKVLWMPLGEL